MEYPFADGPGVGDGSAVLLPHGVQWFSMQVGADLGAVNLWAVPDGSEWALFDTGLRNVETAMAWRSAIAGPLGGVPPARLFATHVHPDHCGMAGWFAERFGTRFHMSRSEFFMLRALLEDTTRPIPTEALDFYRRAGWNDEQLDYFRMQFGSMGHMYYPPPATFTAMADGDAVTTGSMVWEVVTGRGHSPEHLLYYCRDAKLLISGDQVLPRISSNVSVQPQEPYADPLSDWLDSIAMLKARIAEDVLVLPSHGRPFYGLHERLDVLAGQVETGLGQLLALTSEPKRAVDVFAALFRRPIDTGLLRLATGEALAHLEHLRRRGLVRNSQDDQGVTWWQRQ